ncbi:MAG: hypothetical protein AAF251_08130 [Pseudomonadota bacterium]
MSASPTASGQRSSSSSPVPQKAEPAREASKPSARNQAEARSARERFAARLDSDADRSAGAGGTGKASSSSTSQRERVEANSERGNQGGSGSEQGSDERGASTPDNSSANGPFGLTVQATSGIAHTALAGPAIIDPAMLERMAAQIAESWPAALSSSRAQSASVAFPAGAIAQGAQITRGPDGALSVLITGLDPRLAAVQQARLQAQLTGMLVRQRLKVKSVRLETAHQRGRRTETGADEASAIPRAV